MKKTFLILAIAVTILTSCAKDIGNCSCYEITETDYNMNQEGLIPVKLKNVCDGKKITRNFKDRDLIILINSEGNYCE